MVSFLQVDGLTKSFGDLVLFENITFGVAQGQKIGLIAKNGSGKTTLLNIIAGKEDYDEGSIVFRNDLRVGYLEQAPHYPEGLTVLQACFYSQNETVRLLAEYEQTLMDNDTDKLNSLLERMDSLKAWDYEQRAKQILGELKIHNLEQKVESLSGGQLKRVALANVLITEPELIILDEPTNHLDLEMTEWLEDYLNRSTISILMVTHDRYFLDRVCSEIIEIDRKQIYQYKGNYSYYLEKRQERIDAQNAEVERASNLLRKELDWMRRQPQARGTKAKYRIDAFYELEKKAHQQREAGHVNLDVKASYIGSKIFDAVDVCKRFDDLKITDHFNYTFARYEKMGIVGNNGTGKSTFIKMLLGEIQPDSGHFDIGETVRFGYYSQEGLQFDEQMKVIDVVQNIAEYVDLGDGRKMGVSQFLNYFLFTPDRQHSYVYKLSGGEKRRLYLCTVLMRNPNFLVLDEPTNDLDIITLNVLEEYLRSFKGCVIVVSHDRYFMDKVVDHLLVFRGNADIKDFPGNYTQYRAWKEEQDALKKQEEQALQSKQAVVEEKSRRPEKEVKRRLTFKERKEFEALDAEIPALEAEKKELETAMSSGTLSTEELLAKSARITALIEELDEKTMRWLELSEWA
ncbi:ABC-F family ATP-binding cassette domain-containing protein [Parabacteroides sp. AGMB00274]|uniref:ABC-F family ATP-binding cassette domain-containing protein n=1 Tax=Parabacteroides faecalis TaxID=2924040 RepID=A0ABT0C154_9BACT|nr:ABC-F family ATP-binding cassette domain-containing protein [Parabacteroides faecalis]MCI7287224.1 ABC-F family ATP-binding cassette domain-containing protein [Parabacteroides sp.]MCJ2380768.1 ABC-F family ATP-binding cassette domain-containing protein [Parabacteroides faecalis]MDY6255112.1 ABC-F family ATP-binding cassette domain-containing protein [Bacteroidales bacterium]